MWTSAKIFRAVLITATLLGGVAACEKPSPLEQLGEEMDEAVDDVADELDDIGDDIGDAVSR